MDNIKKLKIIFTGIPDMALVCLNNLVDKGFLIAGVVPPKKDHETYKYFKDFVLSKNLNLIEFENSPNEKKCIEEIKKLNADIGVVCSYNTKLSADFLSSTKMGYINCHPSLLPDYRGAAPYFHVINNNEKVSGVTLHFMDENFDTGDIVWQQKFDILPVETMGTIFNRTTYMLSDGLIEVLSKIEKEGDIKRFPQAKSENDKYAPKVGGNFKIHWNTASIWELERLIRACNPFYSVHTNFRGVTFKIIRANVIEENHNFQFGEIVQADINTFKIAAKKGFLFVETAQLGTWGIFSPRELFMIFTPKKGEILV